MYVVWFSYLSVLAPAWQPKTQCKLSETFVQQLSVKLSGCFQVLQRRTIGKLDFFKRWRQYIAGFGDMTEEFWLGELSDVSICVLQTLKRARIKSFCLHPLSLSSCSSLRSG